MVWAYKQLPPAYSAALELEVRVVPLLFSDGIPLASCDPVAPAQGPPAAEVKAAAGETAEGFPAHNSADLMAALWTQGLGESGW